MYQSLTPICRNVIYNNIPISNEFLPIQSILPERFRSISLPVGHSIVDKSLVSDTLPIELLEEKAPLSKDYNF